MRAKRITATVALVIGSLAALSAPASAVEACPQRSLYQSCGPGWELSARNYPTNLAPGHKGAIQIEVFNVGAGSTSSGRPVSVTDTLPPGVTATNAGDLAIKPAGSSASFDASPEDVPIAHVRWDCTGNGVGAAPKVEGASVVTCTNDPNGMPRLLGGAGNTSVGQDGNAQIAIAVKVANGASEDVEHPETNQVIVAGGGARTTASTTDPITISSKPADFRFTNLSAWFSNSDGTIDTQAGSHPFALTVDFGISTALTEAGELGSHGNEMRNIEVQLPPGLVGDPTALPQCSRGAFINETCPNASEVGFTAVNVFSGTWDKFRLFNLVPPPGTPAQFGFHFAKLVVYLDTGVRTGGDNGITTTVTNAPQQETYQAITTIWGVPGDPTHDRWHGGGEAPCTQEEIEIAGNSCSAGEHPILKPFLTLPTACSTPPKFTVRANTWEHPEAAPIEASSELHDSNGDPAGLTGCENLSFGPTITTSPDTARADTPAGFTFELQPPIGGLGDVNGLSTSDIQATAVNLPEGLVINPGQAAGLQACSEAQSSVGTDGAPTCPLASKVGTVTARTPLLEGSAEKELQGNIYLMQSNPPDLKLLVAPSADGVNIKQVLNVHLNEGTGRVETTTANFPQAPVTDIKLSFSGGPQAALDTPAQCSSYQTTADFTPWSSPFIADVFPTASFAITEGPGGSPCPSSPLPFSPSMTAGSTTDQAGAFTNFSLLLQRGDGQQRIEKLQFRSPEGLSAMISGVPLCDEANANAGTCPAASHIGHAVVTSGPGPYPLVIPQPGEPEAPIYLTGPYKGAPFGLSIVTPVIAGPFNLGTIITRAKIEVDPLTAQITITTDPLPQIVDGVPTDLRSINSIIDRPNFLFNPTNCTPAEFTGTATSAGGAATAPLSSHFGVGSCRELAFKPQFKVSTSGKTSRKNGASLHVKLTYPKDAMGKDANIRSVKVNLPKQLVSRLSTLQNACLDSVFNANPASCPSASRIGTAKALTPILPVPLTGPAYFVSHGGAKFPELIIVLSGYGVTVQLDSETFISKAGITSSTFRTIPDVPVGTFELTLPEGKYSALAANGNLCKVKGGIKMPTAFTAQNGAVIHQSTPIGVTGCPKQKKAKKK